MMESRVLLSASPRMVYWEVCFGVEETCFCNHMDTSKLKMVGVWIVAIALIAALTGGLILMDRRRVAEEAVRRDELTKSVEAVNAAHRAYYDAIAEQKRQNEQQMADAKARSDELKKQQPDMVAAHKTQQTQVVQETVPVQYTVPVTAAPTKTAPTRTTKTS